jgi:hypothetical protein
MTMFVKAARAAAVVALLAVPALTLSDAASAATTKGPSPAAKACASHKKGTQDYKDCLAAYRKAHPTTAAHTTKKPAVTTDSGSTTTQSTTTQK